jgi:transposase
LRGVVFRIRTICLSVPTSGGERAVAMYSLIRSARLNDIDPRAYLHYVIEHIPDHAINRIDELARWVVADQLRSLKNHDL